VAANVVSMAVRVSVTVAIVRSVAVTPSKTDNRTRIILIAVAAIVRRSHGPAGPPPPTTRPAPPGGFDRNGS
jgi:hypothetical protein